MRWRIQLALSTPDDIPKRSQSYTESHPELPEYHTHMAYFIGDVELPDGFSPFALGNCSPLEEGSP